MITKLPRTANIIIIIIIIIIKGIYIAQVRKGHKCANVTTRKNLSTAKYKN